jgi:hypothetical protein
MMTLGAATSTWPVRTALGVEFSGQLRLDPGSERRDDWLADSIVGKMAVQQEAFSWRGVTWIPRKWQ